MRDKAAQPVDDTTPALRDVSITGVRARGCSACAGFFYGLAEMPVEGVTFTDVVVEMDPDGAPDYPAMMDDCPQMQGAGLYLRNARGVRLSGVKMLGVQGGILDADGSVQVEDQGL